MSFCPRFVHPLHNLQLGYADASMQLLGENLPLQFALVPFRETSSVIWASEHTSPQEVQRCVVSLQVCLN